MNVLDKTPNEGAYREIDHTNTLGTDTISTSTWLVSDPAISIAKSEIDDTRTKTRVWVAGGVPGSTYVVTNQIVTAAGSTWEDSFPVYIETYNMV